VTLRLYTFTSVTNIETSALHILSNIATNNLSINSYISTHKQVTESQKEFKIPTKRKEKSGKNSQTRQGFCFIISLKSSHVPDTGQGDGETSHTE
jgi:hypothetical protein